MLKNKTVISNLSGEVYLIKANDKITVDCRCLFFLSQAAKNQVVTNTEGLAKIIQLKIGAKFILTASIDIQNRLIYDQMGEFSHCSKYHSKDMP